MTCRLRVEPHESDHRNCQEFVVVCRREPPLEGGFHPQFSLRKPGFVFRMGDRLRQVSDTWGSPRSFLFYFISFVRCGNKTKPNIFFPSLEIVFVILLLFWGNNCTEKYKTSMYTHEWPKHARVGKYPRTYLPFSWNIFLPGFMTVSLASQTNLFHLLSALISNTQCLDSWSQYLLSEKF